MHIKMGHASSFYFVCLCIIHLREKKKKELISQSVTKNLRVGFV